MALYCQVTENKWGCDGNREEIGQSTGSMKPVRWVFTDCCFGIVSCLGWVSIPLYLFFSLPAPSNFFSCTSGYWIAFYLYPFMSVCGAMGVLFSLPFGEE